MSNTILLIVMLVLVTANIVATAQSKRVPISSCEAESIQALGLPFRGTLPPNEVTWPEPLTADELRHTLDERTQ